MEFERKTFLLKVLLILSGIFVNLECSCSPSFDVTNEDLEILNSTCHSKDFCELYNEDNSEEPDNCNCDSSCSLLGACCVDSKYQKKYPKPVKDLDCRIYDNGDIYHVPMIYGCDPDLDNDNTTVELCKSNGELLNDPFLNIPVTDIVAGISYKNYYCFACNENYGGQEPILWNLVIESYYIRVIAKTIPNLYFDKARWLWIMDRGQLNETDVSLYTEIPDYVLRTIPYCYKLRIISDCASNWTDEMVRHKCQAYMALAKIPSSDGSSILYYRNPHCAICNFKSIDEIVCDSKNDDVVNNELFFSSFAVRDKISKYHDAFFYDKFYMDFRHSTKKEKQKRRNK